MSNLARRALVALLLAGFGIQAQAQIQTSAIGRDYENLPPSELKQFSGTTPCYLRWSKDFPNTFSSIAKALKESGFNITDDEKADCVVEITGYMTVPSKTSGSVPVNLKDTLDNISNYDTVGPALKTTSKDESGKIASNASGITTQLDPSAMNALSQVGNSVNGVSGSVVLTGIGVLLDIFSGIHSRQETPSGVVYINAVVMFDGWLPGTKRPALVLGAYAASNTPEKPEALIDAGVKRVAQAIWEHTAAYDKKEGVAFTMPTIPPSASDTTKQNSATGQEDTTNGTAPGTAPNTSPIVVAKPDVTQ
jgi:hypothetical protein